MCFSRKIDYAYINTDYLKPNIDLKVKNYHPKISFILNEINHVEQSLIE
jgi:hypothetical protein